jgi:hypothetical protein
MARPGRPERNRAARSFRQLRRFHHGINSNKVFGTHNAHVGNSTVRDFEKGRRVPLDDNLAAIRRALEEAGVEFITAKNGKGVGVRLRVED